MIAPLILAIGVLAFGLFWLVFRYNFIYVVRPEVNTGGQLYPRALFQLFTGLYVLETCLIGLFCLVRDDNDSAACLFQAVAMTIISGFTVLFHRQLRRVFCPLFDFPLLGLKDSALGEAYIPALDGDKVFQEKRAPDLTATQDLLGAAIGNHGATVWIPQDGLGVSDDEIRWSKRISRDVTFSNLGATIDEDGKVVCNRGPP